MSALRLPNPVLRRSPIKRFRGLRFRRRVGGARLSSIGTTGVVYPVRNPLDGAVPHVHHLQLPIDRVVQRMNNPAADEAPGV